MDWKESQGKGQIAVSGLSPGDSRDQFVDLICHLWHLSRQRAVQAILFAVFVAVWILVFVSALR